MIFSKLSFPLLFASFDVLNQTFFVSRIVGSSLKEVFQLWIWKLLSHPALVGETELDLNIRIFLGLPGIGLNASVVCLPAGRVDYSARLCN
jgi:hypothetical protein